MNKLHKKGIECIMDRVIEYKNETEAKKQLNMLTALAKNPKIALSITFKKLK